MILETLLDVDRPAIAPLARVDIVGVPMDLGAGRRGCDLGPAAIRHAGIVAALQSLGIEAVVDRGDVAVEAPDPAIPPQSNAKHLPAIRKVCAELASRVEEIVRSGSFPLVLGGDHSIAIGTLAGVAKGRGAQPGLIWFDAHSDINTPQTSPSGNVHGMPVAISLQEGAIVAGRTVLIGLRDIDSGERRAIREFGVHAFTMADIDRMGMQTVIEKALEIAGHGANSVHVSFDMDGIDPGEAPGVGTAVPGGMSYREAHIAMETIAASRLLGSMEVTEVNPILDVRNRTAELAIEMVMSALGKTIL